MKKALQQILTIIIGPKNKLNVQKTPEAIHLGNSKIPGLYNYRHSYMLHFPLSLIEDRHSSSVQYPPKSFPKQLILQCVKLQQWFYWDRSQWPKITYRDMHQCSTTFAFSGGHLELAHF